MSDVPVLFLLACTASALNRYGCALGEARSGLSGQEWCYYTQAMAKALFLPYSAMVRLFSFASDKKHLSLTCVSLKVHLRCFCIIYSKELDYTEYSISHDFLQTSV
jgi:hypothetical protein